MSGLPAHAALTRAWAVTAVKHVVVAGLSFWALQMHMVYRVPSEILFVVLPWIGAATTALSLLVLVNHFADAVAAQGPVRRAVRRLEWWIGLGVRGFIVSGVVLCANAELDVYPPAERPSEVRGVTPRRTVPGGLAPYGWLTLRSWDDPVRTIRLLLRPDEEGRVWVGKPMLVDVRRGALRIPWVSRVAVDRERHYRKILEAVPHASKAWKDLVAYHRQRGQWAQVVEAALGYLAIYPSDRDFAMQLTADLMAAERYPDALRILEPFTRPATDPRVLGTYGIALVRSARKAEAVPWLSAAAQLDPANFWDHYHLGRTLRDVGRLPEAIAALERALALKPGYPEVEVELARLRARVAAQRSSPAAALAE